MVQKKIILPQTPQGDRNDVPSVAFPGQQLMNDTDWKNTIHAYDAEVSQIDAQLGIVLDELDRQQLWKNTVVVFLADHGQHLGEHEGTWRKNTLFEESLHVPLIVCMPGKLPGVCNQLVELVDLYATLSELCGLPAPPESEGSSFAPLLDNPAFEWKNAVFAQVARAGPNDGTSITTKEYSYNSWGPAGEELYDHGNDPHEYSNLSAVNADTVLINKMRAMLAGGWTNAMPPQYSKSIFYRDSDSDGFGNITDSVIAYWQPEGFVPSHADCNDADASVYPGATEVCDGLDNNCNRQIDETCMPAISINDKNISEGSSGTQTMKFTIGLNHPYNGTVRVKVATADSTAAGGSDYSGGSGILTFLSGQVSKQIPIIIFGDSIPEQNEKFKVLLSNPVNATISDGKGIGTLWNDDIVSGIVQDSDASTSTNTIGLENKIVRVWPNPTSGFLNVELIGSITNGITVELVNMTGKVLYECKIEASAKKHVQQINTSGIANGIYLLVIENDKGNRQIQKIIISH